MTTLIIGIIGFLFTLVSNSILNPLNPYANTISEKIDIFASLMETVYEVFDAVNFLVPLDVIFICLEISISTYALALALGFIKWLIERITDVIP